MRKSLVRLLSLPLVIGPLLSACGGQSLSPGTGNAGSSASGAGASDGGTASTGGTDNVAGSSASAGESSSGGTAGTTNDSDPACSGPATSGLSGCTANAPFYTHDAQRGLCRPISYGGCDGTENLYQTLGECQAACNSEPRFDTCETPSDCELGAGGCCGVCDGPNVSAHDFTSYNRKYAGMISTCGDVACGPCPEPPSDGIRKYFFADCVQGRCVVGDFRNSPTTACSQETDCMLRLGTGCCPSCGSINDLIAVRRDGSFDAFVCGGVPTPCAACARVEVEKRAVCTDGRCAIAGL